MMENSISSGIRLGTNKIINIEFEKFTDNHLTLNCHEDNLSNFSYPDLNSLTVYVNQDVLELIESDFISQRNKDCSYTDLLVKSLEPGNGIGLRFVYFCDLLFSHAFTPFNKIMIWIESKIGKDEIIVTIFSTEKFQISRLKDILFGDIKSKIKQITFKGKMKSITKKFLTDLIVFDYDPLIYKPIKVNGVDIKEKADRTIMFGEKGFLKRPEMQQIVKKVKMEREKQITDIFFVKVENTTKLCDEPITLEIEYRGKITGYFSRSSFTQDQARKIICNFFDKFGV